MTDADTIPWVEKYRPGNINDIILNENMKKKLQNMINSKIMDHIIITGIPGIGKTTTLQCICNHFYGKNVSKAVLELNASDDRGIKTVHELIHNFCKKKLVLDPQYSKHKIVLLDEADNMTIKAQLLITTLMEKYEETTKFAFTCNESTRLIEAIQSRCKIFRYTGLLKHQLDERLKAICKKEKLTFSQEGINAIIFASQGDLRRAINFLQITSINYKDILQDNVYKLCDKPHPFIIRNIITSCVKKDLKRSFMIVRSLLNKGFSSTDIITSIISVLKYIDIPNVSESYKINFMNEICQTGIILSKGVESELQLVGCLSKIHLTL